MMAKPRGKKAPAVITPPSFLWTSSEWSFPDIERVYAALENIAVKEWGYDIYRNQLEIIGSEQMLDAYASTGLPIMYRHWSFGKSFSQHWESYKRGQRGLAYELVINSNPCINYLMEENTMTMQALVIAHAAFGHNHFFKNNHMFKEWTDADSIIDYLVFARDYISKCEERYGQRAVEAVLDACHALMEHGVDRFRRPRKLSLAKERDRARAREAHKQAQASDMDRLFPRTVTDEEDVGRAFPKEPEENLLYFFEKYAPDLKPWEREIIRITRKISQYFMPQRMTKVGNEGCLAAGSLIDTADGMIPVEELVERKLPAKVWDGERWRGVYDWFANDPKPRVKLTLKNGLTLHGGADHKIMLNGAWRRLDTLVLGEDLPIRSGEGAFPDQYVALPAMTGPRLTQDEIGRITGISKSYFRSVVNGRHACAADRREAFDLYQSLYREHVEGRTGAHGAEMVTRTPEILTDDLGYWLGMLVGDGSMSTSARAVTIVNADECALSSWAAIGERLFGLSASRRDEEGKSRILFHSMTLLRWLAEHLDIKVGRAAAIKEIPKLVLRSPKTVVSAFLRGLFDADGCAVSRRGGQVVYVSCSERLIAQVQHCLLRFDIISHVRRQKDGTYRLSIYGQEAKRFASAVGFAIPRKQQVLLSAISASNWHKARKSSSKIVKIETDVGLTYDFSVEVSHCYVSGAHLHHNCASWTHYRLLNALHDRGLMTDGAKLEFLHSHSGVLFQPGFDDRRYGGLNPYVLGYNILTDIERAVMNPDDEDRRWLSSVAGCGDVLGAVKHAAEDYRDESLIRQFLSPKVIRAMKLFRVHDQRGQPSYEVQAIHDDRGYLDIREALADTYEWHATVPQIEVVDVEHETQHLTLQYTPYRRRSLDSESAEKVMQHVRTLWTRSCTLVDPSSRPIIDMP